MFQDDIPSPGDSISTDSSRITDASSLPRLPSNPSAHIAVSPKTYEPLSLSASMPITESLTSMSALQAADSPYSQKSLKHSPLSTASSDVAMPPSRTSGRQRRVSVKLERPEVMVEPPVERRSTRARRVRLSSSTSSRSGGDGGGRGRGKGRKRLLSQESDSEEDEEEEEEGGGYRETREKNNEASRKSRMNKKAKEMEMAQRASELEKDNRILKMKVEELEKLVTSMRNALLRSALKRETGTNMF